MISAFLKRVSLFIAILIVGWLLIIAIAANGPASLQAVIRSFTNIPVELGRRGDSSMLRFRDIDTVGQVDLLFIGSSHCYRGFDPRIIAREGWTSFNAGSRAQSPLNSYYLLRSRLPRLKPKLAILEMYPAVMDVDGSEAIVDLIPNIELTSDMVEMTVATQSFVGLNALLLRVLDWSHPPPSRAPLNIPSIDRYEGLGFVSNIGAIDTLTPRNFPPQRYQLREKQAEYLRKLIGLLRDQGSEVLLLHQPIPIELRKSIANYDSLMIGYAEFARETGVSFVDFNERLVLNTMTDFYDSDHPSSSGVEKFNAALIEYLKSQPVGQILKKE